MIIFFYGEDTFRSYEKVLEIKNKFSSKDKPNTGLSLFDGKEDDKRLVEKIKLASASMGLFSQRKLIIIKRIISGVSTDEQKKLLEFLKSNLENLKTSTEVFFVFWEEEIPRKNNALFKFLLSNAKKQSFDKLAGLKLNQWILERLRNSFPQTEIARDALEKLIIYVGGNTARLAQEIEKLASFSDQEMISSEMVDLLVRADLDNNIFETIEALAGKRKQKALELLHRHFEKGDDPFYLFSMFIYQFRNLLRIASLQENGIFQEGEIARLAKLHPFVVKKSLAQAKNFGEKKLIDIHQALGELDTKIKTGKIDIKLALDKFIVEL